MKFRKCPLILRILRFNFLFHKQFDTGPPPFYEKLIFWEIILFYFIFIGSKCKLKDTLENLEMTDIKVGSVEQFQGQEKKSLVCLLSGLQLNTKSHRRIENFDNLFFVKEKSKYSK